VTFSLPPGTEWKDVVIDLPVKEKVQIIRLYLPAQKTPVEVQSIRYTDSQTDELVKAWTFK
jgi:hypothetical protein